MCPEQTSVVLQAIGSNECSSQMSFKSPSTQMEMLKGINMSECVNTLWITKCACVTVTLTSSSSENRKAGTGVMVQWVKDACHQSLRTLVQIPINHIKGIIEVHSCNDSIPVGKEEVGTRESLRVLGHKPAHIAGRKK